jgi:Zn-dependent protease with chaperone function
VCSVRLERIAKTFLDGPGVHPPGFLKHPGRRATREAFIRALLSLPDSVYNRVEREVSFIFDSPSSGIGAVAVPGPAVVVFERGLDQARPDLEHILRHEISHLTGSDTEIGAESQARAWSLAER